uniref:Uncharacterized protein n=1 Tax=Molossus molossus TaxID=27622 RepID=A0A7J8I820_MOLMO|nr:hypothetical protein HJG59_010573 [Molossus molossus]
MCAFLGCSPLTAVPLFQGFNNSTPPSLPFPPLTEVPLFREFLTQNFSICYIGSSTLSSHLPCTSTITVTALLNAPPGGFFWCNETLTKSVYASSPFPCLPVTLVSQLMMYGQAELLSLLSSPAHRGKKSSFPPGPSGLSLASSLIAAGMGGGSTDYSITTDTQLEEKLRIAVEASVTSLASFQRQITSLAQVTLQN